MFNFKINLNGHDFYYFNKTDISYYPDLVKYSHKKRDFCLSVLKYLENNFKDKKIFLYKYNGEIGNCFHIEELITLLKLQKFNIKCSFDEILNADIIIFTKMCQVVDKNFVINKEKECYEMHLEVYGDNHELENNILSIINKIKNNYIKLDEFDLDINNVTDENHIIVLGKKFLFKDNIELKYKYKLLTNKDIVLKTIK